MATAVSVDAQFLPFFDATTDIVGFADRSNGYTVFVGDRCECFAAFDGVITHNEFFDVLALGFGAVDLSGDGWFDNVATSVEFGIVVKDRVFIGNICVDLERWEHQGVGSDVAGNEVGAVLWVKHADFVHRHAEHVGDLLEVNATSDVDGVGDNGTAQHSGSDVVFRVIVHYVANGDERRDITACFGR